MRYPAGAYGRALSERGFGNQNHRRGLPNPIDLRITESTNYRWNRKQTIEFLENGWIIGG